MTPDEMFDKMVSDALIYGTGMMQMKHDGKGGLGMHVIDPQDWIAASMDLVAQRFAHRLALDLECVLARYSGPWYDEAMQTLSEYRTAMNELHEKQAPTFMGEPLVRDKK